MNLVSFLHSQPSVHPGVRYSILKDYAAMAGIDAACFARPWSVADFNRALKGRYTIGVVVADEGRVKGYAIYTLHPDRIELLRLAVDPDERLRGVGRRLLDKVIGKLTEEGRSRVVMHVREGMPGTEPDAQIFLRNRGFRATSVVRGHFRDTGEDAYVMEYRIH